MSELENISSGADSENWQQKLDEFVEEHQSELAALAWHFYQERKEKEETLGIDLKAKPRFVACSQQALETLNQNTDHKLQEIVGIVNGYQPEEEVLMIVIGNPTLKLIFFKPEITPPESCQQVGKDFNTLLVELEEKMAIAIGEIEQ